MCKGIWQQKTAPGLSEEVYLSSGDVDALQLAQVCEKLGAGEILRNCIDKDGTNSGFDIELVKHISEGVSIPVIASSPSATQPRHQAYFTGKKFPLRQ